MNNKLNIFVSYGHDEYVAYARKVANKLIARGHEVWFDENKLKPGPAWEEYIEHGLEKVAASGRDGRMLYIMTPHSVRRPDGYCLSELAKALDNKIDVIPVMLVTVTPPLSIYRLQYLDVSVSQGQIEEQESFLVNFTRICKALEDVNYLSRDGVMTRLIGDLDPLNFTAEIKHHQPQFVGRDWMFNEISTWLNTPKSSRIFLLTGMPGIGKTAISTQLIQNLPEMAAFYLCKRGDSQKSSARRAITTIAYQLSAQIPEYRELLLLKDIGTEVRRCTDPASLFDVLIQQPLSTLHNYPTKVILIDAIDEATYNDNNDIAELIGYEFDKLPQWIKVIVTCRPNEDCLNYIEESESLLLEANSENNNDDIRLYINNRLKCKFSTEEIGKIAILLIQRSEGSFLYIEFMCDDILGNKVDDIYNADTYPHGMNGFYLRYFKHKFPDKYYYRENIAPVLEIMLAAQEPLTISEIKAILNWSTYQLNDFQLNMGAYIVETSDTQLTPFHASLFDWLEKRANKIYFIDKQIGSSKILPFWEPLWVNELYTYTSLNDHKIAKHDFKQNNKQSSDDFIIRLANVYVSNNDIDKFVKLFAWYNQVPSQSDYVRCPLIRLACEHFAAFRLSPNINMFKQSLINMLHYNTVSISNCASNGDFRLTPHVYFIKLVLIDFFNPKLNAEFVELCAKSFMVEFSGRIFAILKSGFSHQDTLCGCFVDELRDIFYKLQVSKIIRSQSVIKWMADIAKEDVY